MADSNFRSYRSRDVARDDLDSMAPDAAVDPLAELARLIGQSDPYSESDERDRYDHARSDATDPGVEWRADEGYEQQPQAEDDRHLPPPPAFNPYPSDAGEEHSSYASDERGYTLPPQPAQRDEPFPARARANDGFRDDAGRYPTEEGDCDHDRDDQPQPPIARQPQSPQVARQPVPYTPRIPDERYLGDPEQQGDAQAYAEDEEYVEEEEYYDEEPAPRRRSGLVVVMAVLALAVLGTAGAFGYRAMFGGSVLPTLPPIIKAGNGPNKITPSYGDAQPSNESQAATASGSSTEKMVSREEQPIDVPDAPKTAPRVVSTIPISGGAAPQPSAGVSPPWPVAPPPPTAQAPVTATTGSMPTAASEPKKIRTVIIHSDQSPPANGMAAAAAPPAPRVTRVVAPPKTKVAAAAPPPGSQPLSLSPDGQPTNAPLPPPAPMHTRTAAAPAATPAAAAGGGYAVQITSQPSEAEAQAAFRSLRAKFPEQLGNREPIVRRADLGAKGVFYRAMAGPFASAEAAAEMCSSLKAAGGKCLVQRN
jgi:hypothetical protein